MKPQELVTQLLGYLPTEYDIQDEGVFTFYDVIYQSVDYNSVNVDTHKGIVEFYTGENEIPTLKKAIKAELVDITE